MHYNTDGEPFHFCMPNFFKSVSDEHDVSAQKTMDLNYLEIFYQDFKSICNIYVGITLI